MLKNQKYLSQFASDFWKKDKEGGDVLFIPTIIDVEASGFGRGSYPIEVGYITASNELGCRLIKPEENWLKWFPEAEVIHGIKREVLIQHGKPIKEVAIWLNEKLHGQVIYSDAWMNDMCWLGRLYDEADVTQCFRLESLLSLLSEPERDAWASTYELVISQSELVRHRASSDAKLIQETYIRIKNKNL